MGSAYSDLSADLEGGEQFAAGVDEQRPQPHLRVHAVNVFVRDQDLSLRFFVDQLGFTVVGDVRFGTGQRWAAVSPPDGSAVLSLVAPRPDSREHELIGRNTQIVFVTEDVVGKYREWRKRGVRFSYAPRLKRIRFEKQATAAGSPDPTAPAGEPAPLWGGVFTHFKDIDGNSYALVSFDEVNRAVEAKRRAEAARLEAERRMAQELEIAKQVQNKLFPQTFPSLETLDYAGVCVQAREVGGDYYDFLDLGRERLGLVVGDIAGKGIAAALLMANLQANLRSQCAVALDQPERSLGLVNRLLYENSIDSAYATLFFAEYCDRTRKLRYVNCGHLCALVIRGNDNDTVERLHSTSTVLGLFKEWECGTAETAISCGDTLALYTDGITESFNDLGDEFGEERLIESLRRHRAYPAPDAVAAVVEDVRKFSPHEQYDDRTLIVAKCR
jgi:serine phosphatase RsbU (regulator of sigma subunit)